MLESQTTTKLNNVHPGEILEEEFLKPMNITSYRLAKEIGISQTRISEITKGKRSITADTALRFASFFGTSAEFWMNLQTLYDLEKEKNRETVAYSAIKRFAFAV